MPLTSLPTALEPWQETLPRLRASPSCPQSRPKAGSAALSSALHPTCVAHGVVEGPKRAPRALQRILSMLSNSSHYEVYPIKSSSRRGHRPLEPQTPPSSEGGTTSSQSHKLLLKAMLWIMILPFPSLNTPRQRLHQNPLYRKKDNTPFICVLQTATSNASTRTSTALGWAGLDPCRVTLALPPSQKGRSSSCWFYPSA